MSSFDIKKTIVLKKKITKSQRKLKSLPPKSLRA